MYAVQHAYRSNPLRKDCSSAVGPSIFKLEEYQSGFFLKKTYEI